MTTILANPAAAARYLRPLAPLAHPLAPAAGAIVDSVVGGLKPRLANVELGEAWTRVSNPPKVRSADVPVAQQRMLANYLNELASPHPNPFPEMDRLPVTSFNPDDEYSRLVKTGPPKPFKAIFCHHYQPDPAQPFIVTKNNLEFSWNGSAHLVENKAAKGVDWMAGRIDQMDLPKGTPVLLFSCRAGAPGPDGEPPSAAQIAEATGRPIIAATSWLNVKNRDCVQLFDKQNPDFPKQWKIFYPDGRSAVLPGIEPH